MPHRWANIEWYAPLPKQYMVAHLQQNSGCVVFPLVMYSSSVLQNLYKDLNLQTHEHYISDMSQSSGWETARDEKYQFID